MARVPIAEGIFTWPSDAPQLIGGCCGACGIVTFPAQHSCPRCASTGMDEHPLARRGRLWARTTQEFPPPSPRQVPADPKVGYTQLYGAPGVAGVSILSI